MPKKLLGWPEQHHQDLWLWYESVSVRQRLLQERERRAAAHTMDGVGERHAGEGMRGSVGLVMEWERVLCWWGSERECGAGEGVRGSVVLVMEWERVLCWWGSERECGAGEGVRWSVVLVREWERVWCGGERHGNAFVSFLTYLKNIKVLAGTYKPVALLPCVTNRIEVCVSDKQNCTTYNKMLKPWNQITRYLQMSYVFTVSPKSSGYVSASSTLWLRIIYLVPLPLSVSICLCFILYLALSPQGKYTTKSDVWSFAVTLWEVLGMVREQPFEDSPDSQVLQNLASHYHNDARKVSKQSQWLSIPPPYK